MARSNIYIRNFDKDVSEEVLTQFFKQYGEVKNCKIMVTETAEGTKVSKGFGFVCFEDPRDAEKVVELANKNELILQGKQVFASYYQTKD